MDAEQINKRIHEWLGRGENWHRLDVGNLVGEPEYPICGQCDEIVPECIEANPLYTTDLNAVRKAELKCIEEFGRDAYLNALTDQVVVLGDFNERDTDDLAIATASALTRAQAVCDVLEVGKC